MDDDGELLLLLDREIDEDCELLNRPERRALLLPVAFDFVGMLFDEDRGDVCSGGVGGLATFSTSPLPLPPDFFLRDGILPIFFFAVDGAEEEEDDDDGLIAVLILQQLQYYTTKLCSRLMLVSCDSNYFFRRPIGTSLAKITYHVQHLKLMMGKDDSVAAVNSSSYQ